MTIEAPPPPPQPHAQALCSISFETDKQRPTRVDNEAKACLDDVALDLQKQSDAKAVVVGESNAKEKAKTEKEAEVRSQAQACQGRGLRRTARRERQGLPGDGEGHRCFPRQRRDRHRRTAQTVEDYLVPAGANFSADVQGTTPVDESTVKPEVRKPLPQRHHHKAHPAAK